MTFHQITDSDRQREVVAPLTLAELKALHNALAVDVATGEGTTPGINLSDLLTKITTIINQSSPPVA